MRVAAAFAVWLTFLGIAFSAPADSATLVINGSGQLTGARDVQVGDVLYDVQFLDGTCFEFFDRCDEVSDFDFSTFEQASEAGQALLEQVFLDGPSGLFDSDPALTFGCSLAGVDQHCNHWIPYTIFRQDHVDFAAPLNQSFDTRRCSTCPIGEDIVSSGGTDRFDDTSSRLDANWVIFSVPDEPPISIGIDIKPGNEKNRNRVNICAKGVLPVAIFSFETFDAATEVDPATVDLSGAGVRTVGKDDDQFMTQARDVNKDGIKDLVVKIEIADLDLVPGDTLATLTGMTFGGMEIEGQDAVEVQERMCRRTLE